MYASVLGWCGIELISLEALEFWNRMDPSLLLFFGNNLSLHMHGEHYLPSALVRSITEPNSTCLQHKRLNQRDQGSKTDRQTQPARPRPISQIMWCCVRLGAARRRGPLRSSRLFYRANGPFKAGLSWKLVCPWAQSKDVLRCSALAHAICE